MMIANLPLIGQVGNLVSSNLVSYLRKLFCGEFEKLFNLRILASNAHSMSPVLHFYLCLVLQKLPKSHYLPTVTHQVISESLVFVI